MKDIYQDDDDYKTRINYLAMLLHTTTSQEQRREVLQELVKLKDEGRAEIKARVGECSE